MEILQRKRAPDLIVTHRVCWPPGQEQRMQFNRTRRREFIALLGGAAAWPLAARAQQPNQIARIGYLSQESAAFDRSHGDSAAFRDAMGDLGYVEGKNLH